MRGAVRPPPRNTPPVMSNRVGTPSASQDAKVLRRSASCPGLDASTAALVCRPFSAADRWQARSASSARESLAANVDKWSTCCRRLSTSWAAIKNNSASCAEDKRVRSWELSVLRRSVAIPSTAICVLIPPKPIALTPARSGCSDGQGSPSRSTRRAGASTVSSGCGSSQPVVGGKIWA